MIKFIGSLPNKCTVAFSGGVDSVAIADFLIRGRKDVKLAFFHHGTETSNVAESFVNSFSLTRDVPLTIGHLSRPRPKDISEEEHWRNERYAFLGSFEEPVVTCHHLDDAIETWIFTSLHGHGKLIPHTRGNVVRPFLLTRKAELISWCHRRNLTWCEDSSNVDIKHMRNLIRHRIVPEALKVNPGLHTMIRKKYLNISGVESSCEKSKNLPG